MCQVSSISHAFWLQDFFTVIPPPPQNMFSIICNSRAAEVLFLRWFKTVFSSGKALAWEAVFQVFQKQWAGEEKCAPAVPAEGAGSSSRAELIVTWIVFLLHIMPENCGCCAAARAALWFQIHLHQAVPKLVGADIAMHQLCAATSGPAGPLAVAAAKADVQEEVSLSPGRLTRVLKGRGWSLTPFLGPLKCCVVCVPALCLDILRCAWASSVIVEGKCGRWV